MTNDCRINLFKKNFEPKWIKEFSSFLDRLGLSFYIASSSKIEILHVPDLLKEHILEKTKQMKLIFHIDKIYETMYSGCGLASHHRHYRDDFFIEENVDGKNINEIHYTFQFW